MNNTMCIPHGQSCPPLDLTTLEGWAGFGCLGKIDCSSSSGMVCCGVATATSANTACQSVSPGQCAPTTSSNSMGSAQLCASSAECAPGVPCVPQTCLMGSNLRLCGLHSGKPFNCTQNGTPN
jgi:hypothetical protein